MKRTLLIVDDGKINREILRHLLGDEYLIAEACDGQEALDYMGRAGTELSAVLLDLSMPVMDGYGVLEHMQNDPQLRQIPVVVTTGQTEDSFEVKALRMGASDFVSKPYNPAIIKQRVWNAINLRETAAAVNELQRDRLTGLYSRNAFFEKASAKILSKPAGYYVMACFDIDNFKVINDQYGTVKGDEVLCLIANAFRDTFDAADGLCCRMMADNFAVLYPKSFMDSDGIRVLRQKATQLDGSIQPISFSVGRYIVDDLSLSVSAMYDRAALAEGHVKGRYDQTIAVFDESMRDALLAQQRIVTEMKPALENGEFEPWFQPQYNHATGQLVGAEALARWRHPRQGMIPPGIFIPVFEKNGFIYELDKYIWERVCACLERWIKEGRDPLPVSVNISRYDVFRSDLTDVLTGLIRKYEVPVGLLRLEITESAFSKNTEQIISVVKKLVNLGFTVEIDDFGSGYSSLNTLKDVPAQVIKLDMKFLEVASGSQRGGNILESVVRMAKWLNMQVIAEGVETKRQADFLKSIGCFFVQGYLYAEPMPVEKYEALAKASRKQRVTPALETVANLDSNAFWDPESVDTLIFNSYLGGAGIFEFHDGGLELLRANEKFIQVLSGAGMTMEAALKLNWTDHMESTGRERLLRTLEGVSQTGEESTGELLFIDLPGCAQKVYLRSNMRVVAAAGGRRLIYCAIENITAQRLAEQKRQETTEQLSFLENVAHELLTEPDADAAIGTLLDRMLYYFNGARCYIFEFDARRGIASNTYELCAKGVAPERDMLQNVPFEKMPFWLRAFNNRNYVSIDDVNALGEDRAEKAILQAQGIRSLLAVPLYQHGTLTGFVGIDDPRQRQKQIASLTALGDYAAVLLARRDLAEAISSENQEKLAIMDSIPGGFVRMQVLEGGKVIPLYFSEGLKRLLNMDQEELSALYGENAMNGVHPDDLCAAQKAVAQMLDDGEGCNIRYRLKRGGGGYIWVTIFGKKQISRSGVTYLNIYYTDATEQKSKEDVQLELLDNLPCGAALYEVHGNTVSVIHLNRHYWELVGREARSVDGIDVLSAIHPQDRHIIAEELTAAVRGKRDAVCNLRIAYANAGYRLFHIVGRFIRQEGGRTILCATYMPVSDDAAHMQEILPVILSAIMESTNDLSFAKTKDFRYICASNAFAKLAGAGSARELIGKTDYDLFCQTIADKYRRDDEALFNSGTSIVDMIESIPSTDDVQHVSRTSKYLLRDPAGDIVGLYGTGRDVTEERSMTEKLRISTEEYRLALRHTGNTVCRFTVASRTLTMMPEAAAARCVPEKVCDMPEGMLRLGVISPESQKAYIGFYQSILRGEREGAVIFQCKTENGMRWLEEHFSSVFSGGKPPSAVISYADVTERQEKELIYKKWQQSLRGKAAEDYTLFRCNISKNTTYDTREGDLLKVDFSPNAISFNDRTEEYAKASVFEEDRPAYTALLNSDTLLANYYRGDRCRTAEYREKLPDGGVRWLKLTVELVEYPNSTEVEAYMMYENIDDAKKAELRIKAHAETDPLTGIFNRAAFASRADQLIAGRKPGTLCALLMLDIDDFKLLNDKYGHIAGDRALVDVGMRLQSALRPEDLVGRLGGDEFLVFMGDLPDRAVIARRAEAICEKLRPRFEPGVDLSASMGVAVSPDDGDVFNTLYKKADAALYCAKRTGKDRHAFYTPEMGTHGAHT